MTGNHRRAQDDDAYSGRQRVLTKKNPTHPSLWESEGGDGGREDLGSSHKAELGVNDVSDFSYARGPANLDHGKPRESWRASGRGIVPPLHHIVGDKELDYDVDVPWLTVQYSTAGLPHPCFLSTGRHTVWL